VACIVNLLGLLALVRRRWADATSEKKVVVWTMIALCSVTAYVFLRFNLIFFQAQGRYLYPALVPFGLCSAAGLRGLFGRPAWFAVCAIVVAAGLLALNLYSIFGLIGPRFASP
jgi:hypothetical protein